jgi:ribonuclease PH
MEASLVLTQVSHTIELTDDEGTQYDVEVHCEANGQVEEIIITDTTGCYPEEDHEQVLKDYIEENLHEIINN